MPRAPTLLSLDPLCLAASVVPFVFFVKVVAYALVPAVVLDRRIRKKQHSLPFPEEATIAQVLQCGTPWLVDAAGLGALLWLAHSPLFDCVDSTGFTPEEVFRKLKVGGRSRSVSCTD
jgi:uncharacterized membrane protein YbhN (UPF0104 family)